MGFVLQTFRAIGLSRGGDLALRASQVCPNSTLGGTKRPRRAADLGRRDRRVRVPAVFSAAQGLYSLLAGGRS